MCPDMVALTMKPFVQYRWTQHLFTGQTEVEPLPPLQIPKPADTIFFAISYPTSSRPMLCKVCLLSTSQCILWENKCMVTAGMLPVGHKAQGSQTHPVTGHCQLLGLPLSRSPGSGKKKQHIRGLGMRVFNSLRNYENT